MFNTIIQLAWKILGPTVINLALSVGLPKAIEWLMSKGLPSWLVNGIIAIVRAAMEEISSVDPELPKDEKKAAIKEIKKSAVAKAKAIGPRTGFASETKGLG